MHQGSGYTRLGCYGNAVTQAYQLSQIFLESHSFTYLKDFYYCDHKSQDLRLTALVTMSPCLGISVIMYFIYVFLHIA